MKSKEYLSILIYLLMKSPFMLREMTEGETKIDIDSETEPDEGDGDNSPWLLCSNCGTKITRKKDALKVNSKVDHTFFNPQGIVFNVSCYKRAAGCIPYGEPTTEFSWFGGYRWQYALCSLCHLHLGWRYSSTESSFYGLITKLLIEEE